MYEDRIQNFNLEKYRIHDTHFSLPHHLQLCADYRIAINTNKLD